MHELRAARGPELLSRPIRTRLPKIQRDYQGIAPHNRLTYTNTLTNTHGDIEAHTDCDPDALSCSEVLLCRILNRNVVSRP